MLYVHIAEYLLVGIAWRFVLVHACYECKNIKRFDYFKPQTDGEAGYRSLYLSHAKRALYHLSYIPIIIQHYIQNTYYSHQIIYTTNSDSSDSQISICSLLFRRGRRANFACTGVSNIYHTTLNTYSRLPMHIISHNNHHMLSNELPAVAQQCLRISQTYIRV
jgi:hypothetical protein